MASNLFFDKIGEKYCDKENIPIYTEWQFF